MDQGEAGGELVSVPGAPRNPRSHHNQDKRIPISMLQEETSTNPGPSSVKTDAGPVGVISTGPANARSQRSKIKEMGAEVITSLLEVVVVTVVGAHNQGQGAELHLRSIKIIMTEGPP